MLFIPSHKIGSASDYYFHSGVRYDAWFRPQNIAPITCNVTLSEKSPHVPRDL